MIPISDINQYEIRHFIFIDDSVEYVNSLVKLLQSILTVKFDYQQVSTIEMLEALLRDKKWDIAILSLDMLSLKSSSVVNLVNNLQEQLPIVVIADVASVSDAVDIMRLGANAFVEKSNRQRLVDLIQQELDVKQHDRTKSLGLTAQADTAYYKSIVDLQTELICRYDREYRLTFVNRAYCEWLGLPADKLLNTTIVDRIPDIDRAKAIEHVNELSIENPVAVSTHSSLLPNGNVQIIEWTDRAIFDESGELREYQGVGRNVTDREHATQALRLSEEKYRTLIESSESVIVVVDEAGTLYFANKIASNQVQVDIDSLVGKNLYDLFPATAVNYQLKWVQEVIRTGKGVIYEAPMIVPDGEHWYRTSIQPLRNEAGVVSTVLVNATDITQFKHIESSMHQNEAKFYSIYDQSPIAIQLYDHAGNLTDVNQRTLDTYGISADKKHLLSYNMWANPFLTTDKKVALKNGQVVIVSTYLDFEDIKENKLFPTNKSGVLYFDIYIIPLINQGDTSGYLVQMVDLTERNRVQIALEETNQQLEQRVKNRTSALEQAKKRVEAIFNHSADGILLLNAELKIQQSNYAFDQMFAAHPDAYFNQSLGELMSNEDRKKLETQLEDIVECHETKRMEIRAKRQDGCIFEAEISIAPVNHSNNAVENIVCIIHDISMRKVAERQLQYHASLQNNVSDAVIVTDMRFTIQSWNKAAERMYGWTEDEAIGELSSNILRTEMSVSERDRSIRELQEHGWWKGEVIQYHRDGRVVHVLGSITVIKDENGNPARIVAVNHDITEQKQAEFALRESEARYQRIVNLSEEAILLTDTEARITYVNSTWTRLTGYSLEETLGRKYFEFLTEENRELTRKRFQDKKSW